MKRFRTVKTTRQVPYTVGGQTYQVEEPHVVRQAVQPVDLDQMVRNALWIITFFVVTGAITWSTVAIGHLLGSMAPTWVSYLVAVVFDMTWVACMGAEWLMRYDRKRARAPRVAGWMALGVSVASITVDGHMVTGKFVIGAAGGVVSVLAKGLWLVVMMISARPLSARDQQWYEQAASASDAELALTVAQRKLARTQALVRQERAALEDTYAGLSPDVPVVSSKDKDTQWVFEDKTYRAGLPVPAGTEDTSRVPEDGEGQKSVRVPVSPRTEDMPEDTERTSVPVAGDEYQDVVLSDPWDRDELSSRRRLPDLIKDIRGQVGDDPDAIKDAVLRTAGFEDMRSTAQKRNTLNTAVRRALRKTA